ncbi:MAG: 50S ribosomal protein L22 [Candidatus Diapherotrites archaeon CG11_big_fil_rev_8_21_14_0_20_37_9]|nr:MAG: 50S ribosomal protein L22 [Candidatus Diapherotrites archaeon CG11_big_fil_rev_8_21_14_0_20_37_9]
MVKKSYQIQTEGRQKKRAMAMMKNKPISRKYTVEIISHIKGKRVDKSLTWLEKITKMEEFLPLRKYIKKIGHRKGDSKANTKVGRYPIRTVKAIMELLESVKANADYKGLDSENLLITHMFASEGFTRASYQSQGRIAGKRRANKSTHVEIIVEEAR